MKNITFYFKILTLVLCMVAMSSAAFARVDILPHKVVIEGRERSSEVTIINLSDKVNSYDLKIIHYKQGLDGVYQKLEGPLSPDFDPEKIVRMSPKSFTLNGLAKQKVRISLRKPADLPEGEYRFHILAVGQERRAEEDVSEGQGVMVSVNVGIAIPAIVRHGDLSATGRLADFKLVGPSKTKSKKPELEFLAVREGSASTLGLIEVFWSPDGGENGYKKIGRITNFNIFEEINERKGTIALSELPVGGQLKVVYSDTDSKKIYDEIVINP